MLAPTPPLKWRCHAKADEPMLCRNFRNALTLEAQRHEDMAQALDRLIGQKLRCEIDGEVGLKTRELADQRVAVQDRNHADQLFDLLRLQRHVLRPHSHTAS